MVTASHTTVPPYLPPGDGEKRGFSRAVYTANSHPTPNSTALMRLSRQLHDRVSVPLKLQQSERAGLGAIGKPQSACDIMPKPGDYGAPPMDWEHVAAQPDVPSAAPTRRS